MPIDSQSFCTTCRDMILALVPRGEQGNNKSAALSDVCCSPKEDTGLSVPGRVQALSEIGQDQAYAGPGGVRERVAAYH
jgi:hypothetical protein